MEKLFFHIGTELLDCPTFMQTADAQNTLSAWERTIAYFMLKMCPVKTSYACLVNTAPTKKLAGSRRFQLYRPPKTGHPAVAIRPNVTWVRKVFNKPERNVRAFGSDTKGIVHTMFTASLYPNREAARLAGMDARMKLGNLIVDNCSGKTLLQDMDAFVSKLSMWLHPPVFSISDCNSYHNTGYLFGKYALDQAMRVHGSTRAPVLIINIDQHKDYTSSSNLVNSDGWGKRLLANYRSGAYVNIGCMGANSPTQLYMSVKRERGWDSPTAIKMRSWPWKPVLSIDNLMKLVATSHETRSQGKIFLEDLLNKLWTLLERYIETGRWTDPQANVNRESLKFKYYFITIDRDCMLYNYTHWGHSDAVFRNTEHVHRFLSIVLAGLRSRESILAGLDVTGLPEEGVESTVSLKPRVQPNFKATRPTRHNVVLSGIKTELTNFEALFDAAIKTN